LYPSSRTRAALLSVCHMHCDVEGAILLRQADAEMCLSKHGLCRMPAWRVGIPVDGLHSLEGAWEVCQHFSGVFIMCLEPVRGPKVVPPWVDARGMVEAVACAAIDGGVLPLMDGRARHGRGRSVCCH